MSDLGEEENWKDIRFTFCPESLRKDLERALLIPYGGDKLIAETLGVPQQIIKTAGSGKENSPAEILLYLIKDSQITWGCFYDAIVHHRRQDIQTDYLDKPEVQQKIIDFYHNSNAFRDKNETKRKVPVQDGDPMKLGLTIGDDNKKVGLSQNHAQKQSPTVNGHEVPTYNFYIKASKVTVNGQSLPMPAASTCSCQNSQQTVCSESLMCGGSFSTERQNQNVGKRPMLNSEEKSTGKRHACNHPESPMETDTPEVVPSSNLPNIASFSHTHTDAATGMKGVLGWCTCMRQHSRDTNPGYCAQHGRRQVESGQNGTSMEYEQSHPSQQQQQQHGPANQCLQSSNSSTQKQAPSTTGSCFGTEPVLDRLQSHAPDYTRHGPPGRSQSMTEQMTLNQNRPTTQRAVESADDEKHKSWPSARRHEGFPRPMQSGSVPWDMQYSEFRRGRLLMLFSANNQKRVCNMVRYFYEEFKIGVTLGYWMLKKDDCEEIGKEIKETIAKSHWVAMCLDKDYQKIITTYEANASQYTPIPRNKNFNLRYTYALLKADHMMRGSNARIILLFYTTDVDTTSLPAWLLQASKHTRYKLPKDKLLAENDQRDLFWIFKQDTLMNNHFGRSACNPQAKVYKRSLVP